MVYSNRLKMLGETTSFSIAFQADRNISEEILNQCLRVLERAAMNMQVRSPGDGGGGLKVR